MTSDSDRYFVRCAEEVPFGFNSYSESCRAKSRSSRAHESSRRTSEEFYLEPVGEGLAVFSSSALPYLIATELSLLYRKNTYQ